MNCEQAKELIHAFLDNEFTSPEQLVLEQHLRVCPDCRLAAEQFQAMMGDLTGWQSKAKNVILAR